MTLVLLFVVLQGWQRDLRVPLSFSHDSLEYLMQAKGTIENGWWWVHPRLEAPGVFRQVLYPSNTSVDQGLIWILHWFSSNAALCLNIAWILMVALSAATANRCLLVLGMRYAVAAPLAILFALSPYALYQQPLFCLAIYLLPIPCTLALLIATGRLEDMRRGHRTALIAGAVLVGFNYTYYAFFSCFLIVVATLIAYARAWNLRPVRQGIGVLALICLATSVNLAPSWYAWHTYGKPLAVPEKHPAEADQYGLKIRHLISPVFDNWFPALDNWAAREQARMVTDESEPRLSRLGLVATGGFLALLAALFTRQVGRAAADPALLAAASRLTIAATLLGTVGGFGSLFNLFVSPDIRAYSRLCPFIAFFSLVAVGLFMDRWYGARPGLRKGAPIVLSCVFVLGFLDQSRAAAPMNASQDQVRAEWRELSTFVEDLETRLPPDATVFQLPVVMFLNDLGRERMLPFDHVKPYIVSKQLHWSYPALADSIVSWQQSVGRLPAKQLVAALAAQHFSAIVIDRRGYADKAAGLLVELGVPNANGAVLTHSDRYVALDLLKLPGAEVSDDLLPQPGALEPATSGVSECAEPTAYTLEWIGDEFAAFARPPIRMSSNGDVPISGWAVDQPHHQLAAAIDVVVDGAPTPALYGIDRPDVARALGQDGYRASGFTARLRSATIDSGLHLVSLRILAADRRCYYQGPAVRVLAR